MNNLTNKIAMVVAQRDFRDEEYFIPKGIFENNNFQVVTVSTSKEKATGIYGGEAQIDLTVDSLDAYNFDAVLFIGGPGAADNIDNPQFHKIALATAKANKILGAICIAPMILAKAGVLRGKKATVWSDPLNKNTIRVLEENGAIYQDERVVKDGNIITANGPLAAEQFGKTVVEILTTEA